MRYIAKRYIDSFVPGDDVTDAYDADTLDGFVHSGHVTAVESPEATVETAPEPAATPKAKAKK